MSRQASPFLSLPLPSTCARIQPVNSRDYLFPSPRARDTVSFRLDDILQTAASDSEDFGPALADALPPSGQEAQPSPAYSELMDVLSRATEKLALDLPDEPRESRASKLDERFLVSPCLLLWSQYKFLSLRAVHVPGILNLAADFLSRQKLRPGEWTLNRQTVSQIWDLFGKAEVDLFASQESSQCPLWFSLSFPTTLGIDAFAHPWPNVMLYAFLPIKLIPAVLCRVKVSSARLLLIAPFWPSQTWFSELTPLLYRFPCEIPIRRDLLSQLQGRIWHPHPELWKLWVWPIQGQGP